jgi:HEAT repeat protein
MKGTISVALAAAYLIIPWILSVATVHAQVVAQWPGQQQQCGTIQACYDVAMDKNQFKLTREEAIRRLGQVGQAGIGALRQLLHASDSDTVVPIEGKRFGIEVQPGFVRRLAAETLGSLGSGGHDAVPELATVIRMDEVVAVRQAAAIALGKIGPTDSSAVTALKDVLKSQDYYVWQGAVFALGQLRPNDQEAISLVQYVAAIDPTAIDGMTGGDMHMSIAIMNARLEAKQALQPH